MRYTCYHAAFNYIISVHGKSACEKNRVAEHSQSLRRSRSTICSLAISLLYMLRRISQSVDQTLPGNAKPASLTFQIWNDNDAGF